MCITKSQLEEIWKKAHSNSSKVGSITKNPLMIGAGLSAGAVIGGKMLNKK